MVQNRVSIRESESRKDWPVPPAPTYTPIPTIKTEAQPQEAAKQLEEKYGWGPNCPICKNTVQHEEDWDDDLQ